MLAAGTTLLPGLSSCSFFKPYPDISVVKGGDYYQNTIKAVELIGGMDEFVPVGAKVGLLINSDFEFHGAYVNPDVSLAALKMIFDSGAAEITCLQAVKPEYWQRSMHFESHRDLVEKTKNVDKNVFPSEFNETDFTTITSIPGGNAIKETEVVKAWLDCDVFINIPISKHHPSTFITNALKNIMGLSSRKSNVYFHLAGGKKNNPEHLAQCIAEQNLIRKTDLCIVDATEFIIDNGPVGPGTIEKQMKVVAGSDIVAIDALCSSFVGYAPEEVLTTVKAHELGAGNMNYQEYNVVEINA